MLYHYTIACRDCLIAYHWFVCVLLKLDESYARNVLQRLLYITVACQHAETAVRPAGQTISVRMNAVETSH